MGKGKGDMRPRVINERQQKCLLDKMTDPSCHHPWKTWKGEVVVGAFVCWQNTKLEKGSIFFCLACSLISDKMTRNGSLEEQGKKTMARRIRREGGFFYGLNEKERWGERGFVDKRTRGE
ncbi:hypothetical protein V6N12_067537 [Hibiscus sabdariffa]|uniref:Uncharacterized protein n=1 Tax=Hibiscus sabdariffa TaxID=183260 RepID=A0ABR2B861_9ROSI